MESFIVEIFGWYGVVAILGAYALLSFNILTATHVSFQLLNFTGALGIIIVSVAHKNYQPAVIDIVWALIAFIAIVRIIVVLRIAKQR